MITNDIIYAVRPDGTIEFDTPDGITARSGNDSGPDSWTGNLREPWKNLGQSVNGMHGRFSGMRSLSG